MTADALARAEPPKRGSTPSHVVGALCAEHPGITRFISHCHRRTYPAKAVITKPEMLSFLLRGYASDCIRDESKGEEMVLGHLGEAISLAR